MENLDFDRKRDFGALIEDAFKFGLKFVGPMLKFLLIFVGPLVVLNAFLIGNFMQGYMQMIQGAILGGGASDPTQILEMMSGLFGWRFFVGAIVGIIAGVVGFLTVVGFYNHVREHGTEPTMQDMQTAIFGNVGKLIGQYLVVVAAAIVISIVFSIVVGILGGLLGSAGGAIAGILSIAFLVFAIYAGIKLSLGSTVLASTTEGIVESLRTSWAITTGHWWKIFGAFIIIAIALWLLMALVGGAFTAVLAMMGMNPLEGSFFTISSIVTGLLSLVTYPFLYAVPVLMYYSLTPGKAKGGVDDMIDQIGADEFFGDNDTP